MKNTLLLLLLLSTVLLGEVKTTVVKASSNKPTTNTWTDYVDITLATSYVSLNRDISGASDKVDAKVFPIFSATIGAVFFPGKYDLKLSYTHNITDSVDSGLYNPLNYNDSVSTIEVSVIPYYHKRYGGIGLFYTDAQQNAKYTNKTNTPMPLTTYDWTDATHTRWGLVPISPDVPSGSSYQSKETFSYLGIKYMLPEYAYLPKGVNFYYSIMDRTTVYYGTWGAVDNLIYISGKGNLYGFGLMRELHELPKNKLSLDLLQISKGSFTDFPNLDLYELSLGATYKRNSFYLKAFALVYIADTFTALLDNKKLFIPRQTDTLVNVKVGVTF